MVINDPIRTISGIETEYTKKYLMKKLPRMS